MARQTRQRQREAAPELPDEQTVWLRADYASHVFHYRMPETVAIASVNPIVPSPLTVKMALVASLFREGAIDDAERLVPLLPVIDVRIRPPGSAIVFRALMRYVRPPAQRNTQRVDPNTGSPFGTNPHNREYAIWGSHGDASSLLSVYLRIPQSVAENVARALQQVPYLGAKDSMVTCMGVSVEEPSEGETCVKIEEGREHGSTVGNFVVRLADFAPYANVNLRHIIPSQRNRRHYTPSSEDPGLHVLPGSVRSFGRVKFFIRESQP